MCLGPKVFISNLMTGSFPGCAALTVQKPGLVFYQNDSSRDKFLQMASKTKTTVPVSLEWMDQEINVEAHYLNLQR